MPLRDSNTITNLRLYSDTPKAARQPCVNPEGGLYAGSNGISFYNMESF